MEWNNSRFAVKFIVERETIGNSNIVLGFLGFARLLYCWCKLPVKGLKKDIKRVCWLKSLAALSIIPIFLVVDRIGYSDLDFFLLFADLN